MAEVVLFRHMLAEHRLFYVLGVFKLGQGLIVRSSTGLGSNAWEHSGDGKLDWGNRGRGSHGTGITFC